MVRCGHKAAGILAAECTTYKLQRHEPGPAVCRKCPQPVSMDICMPACFEKQQESSAEKWEVTTVASLINAAEFQYRFANGIYADYPTLVRSGQLQKTRGQFTVAPKTVQSVSDPLPGYLIRLVVTPDGRSYQLSIQEKTFVDCALGIFSDETGTIFDAHIPKAGIMYGLDACGEPQSLR